MKRAYPIVGEEQTNYLNTSIEALSTNQSVNHYKYA